MIPDINNIKPIIMKNIPIYVFFFDMYIPKIISPNVTIANINTINAISGYLIHFGTFLLELISIVPSRISSSINSITSSIVLPLF